MKWIIILVATYLVLRLLRNLLRSNTQQPTQTSPLDFDLAGRPTMLHDCDPETLPLRVYHIPSRMELLIVAPLGRESGVPNSIEIPDLLDHAVPGLKNALTDNTEVRSWPIQLSDQGFIHALRRHIKMPDTNGTNTPWCVVAGKVTTPQGRFMLALALCAAEHNNLGVVEVESEHHWPDVLRLSI